MARPLFKCPKCGYKNYLTREDIDLKRQKLCGVRGDEDNHQESFFGENIREALAVIKDFFRVGKP